MKNLLSLLFITILSIGLYAEEDNSSQMKESDYENGCENQLDDDLDGTVDSDDEDCKQAGTLFEDLVGDTEASDFKPYIVWGVAIALLSSADLTQELEQLQPTKIIQVTSKRHV